MIVVRRGQIADLEIDAVGDGLGNVSGQKHRSLSLLEQLARQLADKCRSVVSSAVLRWSKDRRDARNVGAAVAVSGQRDDAIIVPDSDPARLTAAREYPLPSCGVIR